MISEFNIEDLDENNPMSLFYEFGFDPEDIKSSILDSFDEYFSNKTNLETHATSTLVSTWILYLKAHRYSPYSREFIDKILAIFREAKSVDANQTFDAYSQWFPPLIQAVSRHWTLYKSQSELEKLNLEDFLEESLRIIGQSIEGISKSFLKLLLHMSRIRRNKETSYESIDNLKLGLVVNELIEMEGLNEMLIISPFSIRINQWRNISYHHNSKIISKKIFCWYKQKGQKNEFEVKREELTRVLFEITNIYRVLRIAETVFCVDNFEKIEAQVGETKDEVNIRNETELLNFYAPINSQGFKIKSLESTEEQATLIVKDMMEYPDLRVRAIHASQFLYHLWLYTSSKSLKVEYFTNDSKRFLISEINSNPFEKRIITDSKFSDLMKEVRFTFISSEMKQNKNPFKSLELPKGLDKVNQRFYSQKGDSIPLNEFIRKFTLSVFTNYLVFRSEGFDAKDIKVNVGSDGSVTVGEDIRGTFLLLVPAIIKSKKLQKFIIEIIQKTINLYQEKELEVVLVEEALNNNRFSFKKGLIKNQIRANEYKTDN